MYVCLPMVPVYDFCAAQYKTELKGSRWKDFVKFYFTKEITVSHEPMVHFHFPNESDIVEICVMASALLLSSVVFI